MKKSLIILSVAATLLSTAGAASADVENARPASVLGFAQIDTQNPESVFEFSVHARGNGRSGTGVVWMSHHVAS